MSSFNHPVASLCCVLLYFAASAASSSKQKPNIVFILSDDMGWNDLGYHGSDVRTPNLDALAESGVKLENYYVQYRCSPTRGQLLTGRYQIHTGMSSVHLGENDPCGLPTKYPTLADKLRDRGYKTHIVGKWHLGFYKKKYLPTSRGFDTHYGYYTSYEDYYTHVRGQGVDFHDDLENVIDNRYSTHLYRDRAVRIIKHHPQNKPLFLYLPFQAAHAPMEAPQKDIDRNHHIRDETRRTFAGMVSALDDAVGEITKALKDNGLWDNTLIVFSPDNGGRIKYGGNNWPLRGEKGTYFEGGVHVPAFVSGPFLRREGATSHALTHVTDWFPTLVNLAGGDTSGMGLDGYDIWKTLSKGHPTARTEILHNIDAANDLVGDKLPDSPFDNRIKAALRVGDWKLITGAPDMQQWLPPQDQPHLNATLQSDSDKPTKNLWLFDIAEDPEEKHDRSHHNPGVVQDMLKKMARYYAGTLEPACNQEGHNGQGGLSAKGFWEPWQT